MEKPRRVCVTLELESNLNLKWLRNAWTWQQVVPEECIVLQVQANVIQAPKAATPKKKKK